MLRLRISISEYVPLCNEEMLARCSLIVIDRMIWGSSIDCVLIGQPAHIDRSSFGVWGLHSWTVLDALDNS